MKNQETDKVKISACETAIGKMVIDLLSHGLESGESDCQVVLNRAATAAASICASIAISANLGTVETKQLADEFTDNIKNKYFFAIAMKRSMDMNKQPDNPADR